MNIKQPTSAQNTKNFASEDSLFTIETTLCGVGIDSQHKAFVIWLLRLGVQQFNSIAKITNDLCSESRMSIWSLH